MDAWHLTMAAFTALLSAAAGFSIATIRNERRIAKLRNIIASIQQSKRPTDLTQTRIDPEAHPTRARRPKGHARVTDAHFSQRRRGW